MQEEDKQNLTQRPHGAQKARRKKEKTRCLTIREGGNKLGACGNSWNACFKWIF